MCVSPGVCADGVSKFACTHCRECRSRKILDLTGRCLAEQRSPLVSQCFAVDFTYRNQPDGSMPVGSQILLYGDLRRMLEAVREASRPPRAAKLPGQRRPARGPAFRRLRYLITGEFGHAKGRAHWHAIFFVEGEPMELRQERRRVEWPLWPHGFSYFKDVDRATIAYAAKYALKAFDAGDLSHSGSRRRAFYSKYPPLGDGFFDDLARRTRRRDLLCMTTSIGFPIFGTARDGCAPIL